MFDFRMSVRENFASFRDEDADRFVFVDSFDNREFSVRLGTVTSSREIGVVTASSDEVLNQRLRDLVEQFEN